MLAHPTSLLYLCIIESSVINNNQSRGGGNGETSERETVGDVIGRNLCGLVWDPWTPQKGDLEEDIY